MWSLHVLPISAWVLSRYSKVNKGICSHPTKTPVCLPLSQTCHSKRTRSWITSEGLLKINTSKTNRWSQVSVSVCVFYLHTHPFQMLAGTYDKTRTNCLSFLDYLRLLLLDCQNTRMKNVRADTKITQGCVPAAWSCMHYCKLNLPIQIKLYGSASKINK